MFNGAALTDVMMLVMHTMFETRLRKTSWRTLRPVYARSSSSCGKTQLSHVSMLTHYWSLETGERILEDARAFGVWTSHGQQGKLKQKMRLFPDSSGRNVSISLVSTLEPGGMQMPGIWCHNIAQWTVPPG